MGIWKKEYIKVNGINLHVVTAGPEDGPLVLLLHGFPEFWYGWKNQIDPLVKAGYRVLVPDQRGYNLSDKPKRVGDYTINKLRDDMVELIKSQDHKKAIIIGHDWGGIVSWHLASTRPEYVSKLIPINAPHPAVISQVIKNYPLQLLLSSYVFFFQFPLLPEKIFQVDRFRFLKQAFYWTSRKNTFSNEDMDHYEEAWAQPQTLTSMLNWYRAMQQGSFSQVVDRPITVPVRMIWGRGDQFLSIESAKQSLQLCLDGNMALIEEATHWVTHEYPETVNRLIIRFLQEE